jgi:TctA family transporter
MPADQILQSLLRLLTDPILCVLMLVAIPVGMVFGAVPGLGGRLGIVFSIPFVFGMDPVAGAVFLVAMHAVVHTGGSIPSILLGIPGTGPDAATVCDGHPMTLNGEAGRALGASLGASAIGGVFGAIFLAALVPIFRPAVLAVGPAEFFFLALLGITFIAAVSGEHLAKGIAVGALGLMLSFVGTEQQTGVHRFTLGQPFLWEGIATITSVLGMFTIPELLRLAADRHQRPSSPIVPLRYGFGQLLQGVGDVFRHWALTARASLIGAAIGMLPGLGGDVASWTAYAHAAQTSKYPERFGTGVVEGVIGPEAANNSKEGGALLPTLFFGIPGSSGMVVMLGAFVMLGIQPGPTMAIEHMDLVWILIWTLVVANVGAALMFFAVGPWLARLPLIKVSLLVPLVLLLTLTGGYLGSGHWQSLILMVAFGLLGHGFKRTGWPRAPFAIGLMLGPVMDTSLHQSLAIWGWGFVLRPVALSLAVATVITVLVGAWRAARRRRAGPTAASSTPWETASGLRIAVAVVVCGVFAGMVLLAIGYPPLARLIPLLIGIPSLALAASLLAGEWLAVSTPPIVPVESSGPVRDAASRWRELEAIVWLLASSAIVLAAGLVIGGTIAVMACQRIWLRDSWRATAGGGIIALLVVHVALERGLGLRLFEGLLLPWLLR